MTSHVKRTIFSAAALAAAAMGAFMLINTGSASSAATVAPSIDPGVRDRALAEEQRIADCMSARGFQYVVAVPNDVYLDEAYTTAVAAGKTGSQLHEELNTAKANLPPDPNESAVASLPADQQTAWGFAFTGTDSTYGCADQGSAMSDAESSALEAATTQSAADEATAAADPAVTSAVSDYITCMGNRGYTVADVEEIHSQVDAQAAAIMPPEDAWPDPLPDNATQAQKAAYQALVNKIEAKEEQADAIITNGNTAHEACIGPYEAAFDQAFDRVSN